MRKLWKDFRTNFMYWRFRNITRNRLRLKSWWARNRPSGRPSIAPGRGSYPSTPYRGMATRVYRTSSRRSLIALGVMVGLLTALTVAADRTYIAPTIVASAGTLIIVGSVYWALRGV